MRRIDALAVAALAAALALTGCGGGGTPATGKYFPLSPVLRGLQVGDDWQYTITGTVTTGAGVPQNLDSTRSLATTSVISNQLNASTAAIQYTMTLVPSGALTGTTYSYTEYYSQDLSKTLNISLNADAGAANPTVTTNQPTRVASNIAEIIPGQWANNTAVVASTGFSNGQSMQEALTVTGTQPLNVPIGLFTTWVTSEARNDPNGISWNATNWWAPEMGAPVQQQIVMKIPGANVTLSMTLQLSGTDVPLQ